MCYIANPSGEVTSFVDKPEDGNVIIQIGKVSVGPQLRVSSQVLHKYFKRFESYNFERTSTKLPFFFYEDEIEYVPFVTLMKIVHKHTGVQAKDISLSTLKKVAAYADKFQYAGDLKIRNVANDVKWLEARLKDLLPEDNAQFPVNHSEAYPGDTVERVFDYPLHRLHLQVPQSFCASKPPAHVVRAT